MQSTTENSTQAGQSPVLALAHGSAPSTDGLIPSEVARDIWCRLNQTIHDSAYMRDPLSVSERKLYEALTELLASRANMVAVICSDSLPNTAIRHGEGSSRQTRET